MLEIGVFHNGASSLPVVTTKDGVAVNDGSLEEVHRAAQETLVNQVRQGILAEKLGFRRRRSVSASAPISWSGITRCGWPSRLPCST
jgi:hypothetical protein